MKGIVHRGLLAVAPVLLGIGCRAERLTQPPSGSVVSSATIGPAAGAQPQGLTITEYPVPSGLPQFITAGPDGNLWFTELFSRIGRITTSGVITEFPVPTAGNPNGITAGPDGNLWFADYGADKIGNQDRKSTRLNSSHTVISYAVFCLKKKKANTLVGRAFSTTHAPNSSNFMEARIGITHKTSVRCTNSVMPWPYTEASEQ